MLTYFMKIAVLSKQTKFSEKDVIVLHFSSLFNTWFNGRHLHPHICLCV